jgi:Putative NADPH-quinone reductase (modulator of drug activity B)
MFKKTFFGFLLFILVLPLAHASGEREKGLTGRFVPETGKTLVFAGQNNASSDDFVKIMQKTPAGFMFYISLKDLNGLTENDDFGSGETSGKHLAQKYPGAALQIGLYLVNELDLVLSGSLDANIEKLAKWIKNSKAPVFLRIGYEFDFPENGYKPEQYAEAFRYIVKKMDGFNVKNVAYVWHSYASLNPTGIEAWYPGDDYVDWCAISYFTNPQWIPMVKFAQRHSKPLMIAECAPMLGNDLKIENKANWYNKLFKFIAMQDIKALCYINNDWDKLPMFASYQWGDSRINVSKDIEKLWKENISDKRYIFYDKLYNTIDFENNKNVLVVFCHPDKENSFNGKILKTVIDTLDKNSIVYEIRDLYAMRFNPVMSKKDLELVYEKQFPKDIQREQNYIKNADTVIFIYPLWWSGFPAMLKGYIDRVFYPGFAFDFSEKGGQSSIKYKKAIVFTSMGMSQKNFIETKAEESYGVVFDEMVFASAGLKVMQHKYFTYNRDSEEAVVKGYMEEIQEAVNTIK